MADLHHAAGSTLCENPAMNPAFPVRHQSFPKSVSIFSKSVSIFSKSVSIFSNGVRIFPDGIYLEVILFSAEYAELQGFSGLSILYMYIGCFS